jgi:hypothetical protein
MRLFAVAAGLSLMALLSLPATAQTFETPEALLDALYAPYLQDTILLEQDVYLSDALMGLYDADAAQTAAGDAGTVDFDPVIAGNDYQLSNYAVTELAIAGDYASATVTFDNHNEPITLEYSLFNEGGNWQVDDIEDKRGEYPWQLTKLFEGAVY